MFNRFLALLVLSIIFNTTVSGQSNYKEGSNSFARYMKTGDMKQLESAKKFIDDAYKTKRDSTNSRNSILRAMIYSSLAYADSTRKIKSNRDHIDMTEAALSNIRLRDKRNFENEINYVNQNLIAAYIYVANKAVAEKNYEKAYTKFLKVRELNPNNNDVLNNLSALAAQAGKNDDAITYYNELIKILEPADVSKYLALAELYKIKKDNKSYLQTLLDGRKIYPSDKSLLFLIVQYYGEEKNYAAILPFMDQAIEFEPDNIDLIYLAGFANENENNKEKAKEYYAKVLSLDENHYDANLALGLIYLNELLNDSNNLDAQYNAQNYLLRANSIKPYAINTLKGLALYYQTTKDDDQLDRVNMLINQLSDN